MIVGGGTIGGLEMRGCRWLVVVVMVSFGVLVLPPAVSVAAAVEECPNEAVRVELGEGWLPDCRGYEMVTPPYKEGSTVYSAGFSSNGETAIMHSSGSIAGTPGTGEGGLSPNWYVARRTADGWRLSSMMAPLSEFVGQLPVAQEADDGMSLWVQHTPQQSDKTMELYIRSADGAYSRVGPLTPQVGNNEPSDVIEALGLKRLQPVAATRDYQHIVFEAQSREYNWPFDKTISGPSLYEYSGMGNEQPVLVAVEGAEKGSRDLIAECGSELGSVKIESAYNALSSDGETIFFTVNPCSPAPGTAEVYARLHGGVVSPGPAETVDVSESECGTGCGEQSGKEFEGASEDGEKVFFTSTQKLTDGAVDLTAGGSATTGTGCAGSASGCNLYEYDFSQHAHERLTLVAGGVEDVRGVAGIAEDGSRVYFVARSAAVPGAGENEFDRSPVVGEPNLYVYDTGTGATAFIATLSEADEEDWERSYKPRTIEVTGEGGRFLLFPSSAAGVTPDETSGEGIAQLFEYDAVTRELVRVSQGEEGYNDNGNGVTKGISVGVQTRADEGLGDLFDYKPTWNRLSVSRDGKTVVFVTRGELSPRAASASALGCRSVYEFRSEGAISAGTVHLLSDGRDVQPVNNPHVCGAYFEAMDADGSNVLIATDDPLLPSDVDGVQSDTYDVRIDGGFPLAISSVSCEGGGCEGVASGLAAPVFGAPASASVSGGGNLSPSSTVVAPAPSSARKAVRCARGRKLSHGKCVRVKAKRRKKAKAGRAGDRTRRRG
jgi:hypothetical protein